MEREPNKIELEKSIENVDFKIVEKNANVKTEVMDLLHQYPDHFVHGLFEQYAEQDFSSSDIVVAYDGDIPIGCLMLNRTNNEFLWLAIKKDIKFKKSEIAKKLFETFYVAAEPGTKFIFNIPTEDSSIPGNLNFTGKNFEPARKMYRSMGLEMKEENRVENNYGPGAHVYRVEWIPNKKTE